MKNNKTIIGVAFAGLMLAATTSQASLSLTSETTSGQTLSGQAASLFTSTGTQIGTSWSQNYSVGSGSSTDAGTFVTSVYSYNGGDLFVYAVTLSAGDLSGITASSFSGPVSGASSVGTTSFVNNNGGVIFDLGGASVIGTTYDFAVWTPDTIIVPGQVGIKDDTTANEASLSATAVPEASTVMAGMLMILPLGVGAFRALRKERMA
jgi:hypothetical protein